MSHYEDYSRTAGHYDATRSAVGSHIWLGHVAARFDDPSALRVLDAGCGTGNYALALAPHVGRVTALDRNPRMLDEARAKAAAGGGGIEFRQGELLDLPLAAESFDVVMFNQVLHHLEPPGATGFPGFRGAIAEAARVLRAGGLVFINACARRQMRRGFWYHALIPGAARKGLARTIGSRDLRDALQEAGFADASRTVPLDALLQGEACLDPLGPLDEGWRAGDSIWALATGAELASALDRVSEMKRAGTAEAFMREHDSGRADTGQTTFWCAVRQG